MKKVFRNKNNSNFYYLKELQWSNKALKSNTLYPQILNNQERNTINYLKEKSWNKRFIYDKIQNYDSTKDKNVIANLLNIDEMNCYHNAIKKNGIIMREYFSTNKIKKKMAEEYNKTNIKINLNPMGKNMKIKRIISNSYSSNNIINNNNNIKNKTNIFESLDLNPDDKIHNNINLYRLTKIWDELCIMEPYRELFNIILLQLSQKRKEDIIQREYNDLNVLKHDLNFLSTSVYYRLKILEKLQELNDKLGIILKSKQISSNEVIIKNISQNIESLREHTVNICFLMKKIKSKIFSNQSMNKYDFDAICEKYKFDKNYIIKMKEEMTVLREGFTKYFFDIGNEDNPFLLKVSEKEEDINNNSAMNIDPFYHYIPISKEMKNNINQCIYIIYQELIGYQNSNVSENNFRNISQIKKYKYSDIKDKIYKKNYEKYNRSFKIKNKTNFNWSNNLLIKQSEPLSPYGTSYSQMFKSLNNDNNNDKEISIIKRKLSGNDIYNININNNKSINGLNKDNNINNNYDKIEKSNSSKKNIKKKKITNENSNIKKLNKMINNNKTKKDKTNTKDINKGNINNNEEEKTKKVSHNEELNNKKSYNNINNIKYQNELSIINSKNENIEDKNEINFEEKEISENSEKTDKNRNKNSQNIKITIYNDDINIFFKDLYPSYYSSISQEIKDIFNINEKIIKKILYGISPYILIAYSTQNNNEINTETWLQLKNKILGICIFSYEYKNNSIKLNLNHISALKTKNDINEGSINNFEEIANIFNLIMEYIKSNFYYDEIIIEYNSSKANENILNIFLNDLNFCIINETENEEIEEEENIKKKKNDDINKMVFANDSTKNRVNDDIRENIRKYIEKNILKIFDSLIILNNSEIINLSKGKKNDINLINNILMKYLIEKKEKSNIKNIYNKVTSLEQFLKLFKSNNINNKELPASLLQNKSDILSIVLNDTLLNNNFSNSHFFNNYNINNPNSYLDNKTNYYYNFIKVEKLLILKNDKYNINFYHILNNDLSLFLCNLTEDITKFLNKGNFYTQMNIIYKETLSKNAIEILDDKIIWIPCFEVYKHLKTFSNNFSDTLHEYLKISNNKIKTGYMGGLKIIDKNQENQTYIIKPDLSRDIFIENDFIFGLIINAEILEDKISDINEKDDLEEKNKNEPYVIFCCCVNRNNFISNNF